MIMRQVDAVVRVPQDGSRGLRSKNVGRAGPTRFRGLFGFENATPVFLAAVVALGASVAPCGADSLSDGAAAFKRKDALVAARRWVAAYPALVSPR